MLQIDLDEEPVNRVLYNKHRRRKNHDIVAAMYAMYLLPKSLEQIGKSYRKSRQAVYDLFRSRGYILRSKELRGLQYLDGIAFTFDPDGYLRGTLRQEKGKPQIRIWMHRYVWEKSNGPIPEGYGVGFIDGERTNNTLNNLHLIKLRN